MANQVNVQSRKFETQKEAEAHYYELINKWHEENSGISEGDEHFPDFREIYTEYCKTEKYQTSGLESGIKRFWADYSTKPTSAGIYRSTVCCHVEFNNGGEDEFSIKKAIKAIANEQRSKK